MKNKMIPEGNIEKLVEKQLSDAGLEYEIQPIVGHARPDFLIRSPDGKEIVLEVKGWSESPESIARAARQAKLYEQLTKAASYIALSGLSIAIPQMGVITVADLTQNIADIFKSIRKRPQTKVETETNRRFNKNIFAAMPYSPKYDDTFLVAIAGAAIETSHNCKRIDYSGHYGDVVAQIKSDIAVQKLLVD